MNSNAVSWNMILRVLANDDTRSKRWSRIEMIDDYWLDWVYDNEMSESMIVSWMQVLFIM